MSDDHRNGPGDIAIIGMAGRFPGARNVEEFWRNLAGGVESIRRLSDEELKRAGVPRRDLDDPTYVKACPVLEDIDKFDAAFFGISPLDASVMDPAHRFFLEVAWQALEDSGNTGLPEEGRVGVFATSGAPMYWINNVRTNREIMASLGEFLVRHTGNDMNFLATRVSYEFDLRGPSLNIQTACSSSLVAAHVARQSLLAGECDMALIGGATILTPMGQGYHYKEGEILSPDGHCRPFDHRSAGTVFGSGAGCLVLKRLDDALDNGDTIHAVIKGSAINNDGSMKVGYLAPGVDGQVSVIRDALADAQVNARSISYIEAHGTGTSVGDPIELTALEQAFAEHTQDKQFCGIGSVKSNIGHLGEAAATASLIKVALALKHRLIPPSLGYEKPNPRFEMDDSPFFVTASPTPWEGEAPLRAGITALGAGGTNCHLILEEAPPPLPGEGGRDRQLLVLSAKTKSALDRMSENLALHLEQHADIDLGDAAYTLAMGRRPLTHRRVLVAKDRAEAIALLRGKDTVRVATVAADANDPEVVFTFPGGGAQYARMCFDLYDSEPAYRDALDECFAIIDAEIDPEIRRLLFAPEAEAEAATRRLERPSLTLPTLFAVEYALAKLFQSYGLRPAAFIGHSMGEYVAACLAGVFSLRDGLRLVHLRGRLFERTQKGNMIGVPLSEAELRALMPAGLSIAAVNAPELCVASGPSELIAALSATLDAREIDWTPIHIDVAAHSSLLDPILDEFRRFCRSIEFQAPRIPIASNYTGQWLTPAEATDPEYWVSHLRNTVRFADCVETVLDAGNRVFLEVGPGRTLTTLVGAQRTKVRNAVNSVRHPREPAHDLDYALLTLGKVWAAGVPVDWTALYDNQLRNRIPLPVYPFEGQSYWLEPKAVHIDDATEPVKRENIDDWFATVAWEQTPLVPAAETHKRWLIFAHDKAEAAALGKALPALCGSDCEVVTVKAGSQLRRLDANTFEVKSGDTEQYRALLETLKNEGRAPEHLVMLVKAPPVVTDNDLRQAGWRKHRNKTTVVVPSLDAQIEAAFFAPVHLAQAMAGVLDGARLSIVGESLFSVRGEAVDPAARLSAGPAEVLSRELPDFSARLIDLGPAPMEPAKHAARIQQLARELALGGKASPVALRAPGRWTPHLRAVRLPAAEASQWLEDGDVVFVTGGLGGIGLVLAEHLARRAKVNLALLSRDGVAPRDQWPALLAAASTPPQTRHRIAQIQALEALGAKVLAVRGDVTDEASLRAALTEVRATFGAIDAVIHAAGVMDDELFVTRSDDKMRRVLAPKVQGTVNLDALVTEDLKAFVLMSSIASFLGLPGQIDYTAANAFLDAFAEDRQQRKAGRTLVINWNAWRDVGMIVNIGHHAAPLPAGRTRHPWLDAAEDVPGGKRFFTDFSVAKHWLLAEHQIVGADALIPGTGFVELARAAFVESTPAARGASVELSQVTFLHPFQVGPEHGRRMQIDVETADERATVSLRSAHGHETHMTAEAAISHAAPRIANLDELRARCTREIGLRDRYLDQDFMRFGPRWQNLDAIRIGEGEAFISLSLSPSFGADLGVLACHPALMDMATGAAQYLIPGFDQARDFLVPFGYDRICIHAPVTQRLFSHVRLQPGSTADIATFDVSLFDDTGTLLIDIAGFTMKRVDAGAGIVQKTQTATAKPNAEMEALLREAITPAEGVIAFDRALAQQEAVQIIASSVDVDVWSRKLERDAERLRGDDSAEAGPSFSRPTLSSDYVAPVGGLETQLAAIWSRLLGVSNIGVLDDFFELGGNSLIAVRFFARVKKDFGISLPLSTLFQAPTIRSLAGTMQEQGYRENQASGDPGQSWSDIASVSDIGAWSNQAANVMPPLLIRPGHGRPPIFFVHDGLGEVLLYRSLALRLHPDHAVYGLDPETRQGRYLHTRIADMARAKVDRIRSVQPHGPYLLAGLCAGGVIAFEVARQLQDAGEDVAFVGIIDAADVKAAEFKFRIARERFERVLGVLKPQPDEGLLSHIGSIATTMSRKTFNLARYAISSRVEHARNARKVSQMRTQTSGGNAVNIDFIKLYEQAHREHEPCGMFRGGDVVLFRATQEIDATGDIPFREIYADPLLGWQCRVEKPVTAIDVPGGHSSALQEPHVATLAREMQSAIDRALPDQGADTTAGIHAPLQALA